MKLKKLLKVIPEIFSVVIEPDDYVWSYVGY